MDQPVWVIEELGQVIRAEMAHAKQNSGDRDLDKRTTDELLQEAAAAGLPVPWAHVYNE